jgi:N-acetylneuraminate synthase
LSRTGGGPDDSFSLEPNELAALCNDSKTAWAAIGKIDYGRKSSEQGNVKFRRSLYFVKDMRSGETITRDSIRIVRPGFGLAPKNLPKLLGRTVNQDIKKATAVNWKVIS